MAKVKLIRPLDGLAEGSFADYPDDDANRLLELGAVELVGEKAAPSVANKKAPAPENKKVD